MNGGCRPKKFLRAAVFFVWRFAVGVEAAGRVVSAANVPLRRRTAACLRQKLVLLHRFGKIFWIDGVDFGAKACSHHRLRDNIWIDGTDFGAEACSHRRLRENFWMDGTDFETRSLLTPSV